MSTNTEIKNRKAAKRALTGDYYVKVMPKNKLDRANSSQYSKIVKASKTISHVFDGIKLAPNPYLSKYQVVK